MNTINEYDLQFGLLALRMFFVNGDQLIAAINDWENRGDVRLSSVLIEIGAMGADECGVIESMMPQEPDASTAIPKTDVAPEPSSDQPVVSPLSPADAAADGSGTIDASIDSTLPTNSNAWDAPSRPSRDLSGGRFEIQRSFARGALGEVFIARDTDLRRNVALKQMLDHCAENANSRARFIFEAEVTGALEHPGIVPIYALGNHDNGRPYYAMRFIEGSTMEAVIDSFHAEGGLNGDAIAALTLRELLGQMISICRTIGYAHSRGIVHRDIKPANVMLGQFGETLVVDWGLAKIIGTNDDAEASAPDAAPNAASENDNGFEQSQLGQACGTPQFMSPEQSIGRHDLVNSRSDIYSLGATLYKLLTGKPAFTGSDLGEVLDAVRAGRFLKPRQVAPAVPKPLEAICLKAMAADPAKRYASAISMADDISNWLADQPVNAYGEPLIARTRRWMRRHRSFVGSAAVAGCVVFAVLIGSVAMLTKAYQTAERHRKQAHSTVNQFFTTVSEDTLLKKPGMENLRTDLLEQALTYYRGFLAEEGRGSLEREIGLTNYYVGRIVEDVESPAGAEPLYRTAETAQRKLLKRAPDDHELMAELANTLNALGRANDKQGRTDRALNLFKESMNIRKQLADEVPDNVEYQRTYANGLMNLGLALGQQENYTEAIDFISRAQEIRAKEKANDDSKKRVTRDLAKGDYNLALIELTQRDIQAARKRLASASANFEELLKSNPDDLDDRYSLGVVKQLLANIELEAAGFETAEPIYQEAVHTFEKLLFRIPGVPEYQYALANIHISLGEQQTGAVAIQSLDRAKTIVSNLAAFAPDDARYPEDLTYIEELIQENSPEENARIAPSGQ
ncbi:serine/threonine-protein kinase [Aporhodopirellula aestuarii]|uniref:Serine/threonine-protein kinase n=1 Tax=Aporhodopirellula aestuarii TaxID=2950107 RepID=A0ABT0TZ58_9BACT|nr:serine/threonine-protein kinase [Aporhodopirellula aestuarii]MCM2369889.1 serine/threonine-protein kinase [Aporhodopirellula aestuarii]